MTTLRDARLCLADLLHNFTSTPVIPHPPRQTTSPKTIFFGAMSGSRETQDGGELANIPVLVTIPATTDGQYDVLDGYIDGTTSIVDAVDKHPTWKGVLDDQTQWAGISFGVSGDWKIEMGDVAGGQFLAATFDVEARWR